MLVLSRELGQRIRIGNDVWITVIDIDRKKIRLGIEAPKSISVSREEILPEAEQRHNAVLKETKPCATNSSTPTANG